MGRAVSVKGTRRRLNRVANLERNSASMLYGLDGMASLCAAWQLFENQRQLGATGGEAIGVLLSSAHVPNDKDVYVPCLDRSRGRGAIMRRASERLYNAQPRPMAISVG